MNVKNNNPLFSNFTRFEVPAVRIYIADRFGLLVADQVQWIALHEIGHALGMRQHSPIPADLMYEVVRDRILVRGPSMEDANSFVSLYRLPNGTVFGHIPSGEPAALHPMEQPTGPPRLAMAPYVDPRLGQVSARVSPLFPTFSRNIPWIRVL